MARPALKRSAVAYICDHYATSRRRACRLVRFHRSVSYYRSVKGHPSIVLRSRMREIAQTQVRFGYRRIHVLLRREGWYLGKGTRGIGSTPRRPAVSQ